jgi:hypothetical protein
MGAEHRDGIPREQRREITGKAFTLTRQARLFFSSATRSSSTSTNLFCTNLFCCDVCCGWCPTPRANSTRSGAGTLLRRFGRELAPARLCRAASQVPRSASVRSAERSWIPSGRAPGPPSPTPGSRLTWPGRKPAFTGLSSAAKRIRQEQYVRRGNLPPRFTLGNPAMLLDIRMGVHTKGCAQM